MENELLITRKENKILSLQLEQGKICQIHAEETEQAQSARLGNIYIGKVRNIVKNINAAFVEFAPGQTGYLSLADPCIPMHTQGAACQEGRVLIGDEILVQIAREAVKTKPPTLTGQINLTGRYTVLTTQKKQISISKKIKDKPVREELAQLLQEFVTDQYGFIVRTNGAKADRECLRHEGEALCRLYDKVVTGSMHKSPLQCVYQAPEGFLADIRDGYRERMQHILTDDAGLYEQIREYLADFQPEDLDKLSLWDPEHGRMDAVYNISRTLEHALMPKVWLKSGAYLIIQPTEALVSIDVNTGKAVSRKKDVQKTFLKVNKEAAYEIAHQLRLRNLSGIILIDFIDMESQEDCEELLKTLRQAVQEDQVQTTVVDMTRLGLVEVTRKKLRKSLWEQMRKGENNDGR